MFVLQNLTLRFYELVAGSQSKTNNFNKRKIKSLVRFFPKKDTEKHANSGISMRNRTAISRERESYH